MYELLLAGMVVSALFLGVRAYMKFRDISNWTPEGRDEERQRTQALPQELEELKIESPPPDLLDSFAAHDDTINPDGKPPE